MRDQRGFTLIEIMIAVAIVAVLALIAIPLFSGESRKGKAKSEIGPMFAEFANKEEAYKIDNNAYLDLSTAYCPTTPSAQGQSAATCASSTWTGLRVMLPTQSLYCSYKIVAGASGTTPSPPAGFTFLPAGSQAMPWYYLLAQCDMDGSSGTNSFYFQGSGDGKLQIQNEGK